MSNELLVSEETRSINLIEGVNVQSIGGTIQKIKSFQQTIRQHFTQGHDYGIIPRTSKPTLLKPGAEKLLMLLGLSSEFEVMDSTRDFEEGFFQYQIKCLLKKDGYTITEGFGSCNTKESKYIKQDPYSIDNTVLKMAKKRALVDAALLVGSLSDIFTQDLEDMDLDGNRSNSYKKQYTDGSGTITANQRRRMFALANGNNDLVKYVLEKYKYTSSEDVKKLDYQKICDEIVEAANEAIEIEVEAKASTEEIEKGIEVEEQEGEDDYESIAFADMDPEDRPF